MGSQWGPNSGSVVLGAIDQLRSPAVAPNYLVRTSANNDRIPTDNDQAEDDWSWGGDIPSSVSSTDNQNNANPWNFGVESTGLQFRESLAEPNSSPPAWASEPLRESGLNGPSLLLTSPFYYTPEGNGDPQGDGSRGLLEEDGGLVSPPSSSVAWHLADFSANEAARSQVGVYDHLYPPPPNELAVADTPSDLLDGGPLGNNAMPLSSSSAIDDHGSLDWMNGHSFLFGKSVDTITDSQHHHPGSSATARSRSNTARQEHVRPYLVPTTDGRRRRRSNMKSRSDSPASPPPPASSSLAEHSYPEVQQPSAESPPMYYWPSETADVLDYALPNEAIANWPLDEGATEAAAGSLMDTELFTTLPGGVELAQECRQYAVDDILRLTPFGTNDLLPAYSNNNLLPESQSVSTLFDKDTFWRTFDKFLNRYIQQHSGVESTNLAGASPMPLSQGLQSRTDRLETIQAVREAMRKREFMFILGIDPQTSTVYPIFPYEHDGHTLDCLYLQAFLNSTKPHMLFGSIKSDFSRAETMELIRMELTGFNLADEFNPPAF
ncbi:hypothetical protein H4R33_003835 [Dimargaris cristalligena]|nr:hypothetical protein H4R33_003835 [Dimargaris cristalligena]